MMARNVLMNAFRRPARLGLALMAGVLALAAACGEGQKPSVPDNRAKGPRLAAIVFQEDQFFRLMLFGMREAAREAGVELMEANSNNKPEKEIELVNTYVTRQVDAILISPLSKKGSIAALKLANDRGVKVVTFNTPVEADFPACFLECSPTDLGQQTGRAARKYIEEKLGGKARIAILAYKSLVPEQSGARVEGFKREVSQLPGVEFVAEQDAWLADAAVKKAGDILIANPDVDIIYGANEGGTVGAVLAVKNAGKAGKVAVFGTDVSEQLIAFLQSPDGILQAVTAQRPVDIGRQAVASALKSLKGEPLAKQQFLEGVCLTRTDPAAVEAYRQQLKAWMAGGN